MPPSSVPGPRDGDDLLERFEAAWRKGTAPILDDYLPRPGDARRRQILQELVIIDLDYRWRVSRKGGSSKTDGDRGGRLLLEEYLARYPELGPPEQASAELIAEEYRVRRWWGESVDHVEYAARFPRQAIHLKVILTQVDAELEGELRGQRLPAVSPPCRPAGASLEGVRPMYPTIASAIDSLRSLKLLSPGQLEQVAEAARRGSYPDARALVRDLVKRSWLTAFQANQLMQGRDTEQIIGPYLLLERLGEGGAGQVFKARHQKMNRIVALKLLRKELLADAEVVARFYREIQVVSQLDHPNVVHAYDAGPAGAGHFLAMEYVEGTDLGKMVKEGGPLPVEQACEYIRQAACGLQYAHERGLVHRDIKPHNLILSLKEALVKVTDLGLARLNRPANEEATAMLTGGVKGTGTLTPENATLIGTLDYLAPEQALDFHRADIRSDIYSLGCTFYYLLTGQPPFTGTLAEKLMKHQQTEPMSVEQFRKDVPAEALAVLRKMLAKKPEGRFQTPRQVAESLPSSRNVKGHARPGPVPRKVNRRRAFVVLAGGLVAAGFAAAGWQFLHPSPKGEFQEPHGPTAERLPERPSPLDRLPAIHDRKDSSIERLAKQDLSLIAVLGKRGQPTLAGITISPNGKLVGFTDRGKKVYLWDAATQQVGQTLEADASVQCLAFSPDSRSLVGGCEKGGARLWRLGSPKAPVVLWPQVNERIGQILFSPDGKNVAGVTQNRSIMLWDDEAQPSGRRIAIQTQRLASVTFSPASKELGGIIMPPGAEAQVAFWDVATAKPTGTWTSPPVPAIAFTYAADEKKVVLLEPDGSIRSWDIARQKPDALLAKPEAKNPSKTFYPDSTYVALSLDGKKLFWKEGLASLGYRNLAANKEWSWQLNSTANSLSLTQDGRYLAVTIYGSMADGTAYIFRLPR